MRQLTAATLIALMILPAAPGLAQQAPAGDGGDPAAAGGDEMAWRQLPDGGQMRADDLRRLGGLDRSYGAALRQAMASAEPRDLNLLLAALRGQPLPAATARDLLPGDWSCQMMKVGGGLPLVVYSPFKCRVDADGGFEKLTGSQRTRGAVHAWNDMLIYLGTGYVWDSSPVPYADLPEIVDPTATPQLIPEAGLVEMTDADAGRILFPEPYLESRLNVLVLRR